MSFALLKKFTALCLTLAFLCQNVASAAPCSMYANNSAPEALSTATIDTAPIDHSMHHSSGHSMSNSINNSLDSGATTTADTPNAHATAHEEMLGAAEHNCCDTNLCSTMSCSSAAIPTTILQTIAAQRPSVHHDSYHFSSFSFREICPLSLRDGPPVAAFSSL